MDGHLKKPLLWFLTLDQRQRATTTTTGQRRGKKKGWLKRHKWWQFIHTRTNSFRASNQTEAGRTAVRENEFCSLEALKEREERTEREEDRKKLEFPLAEPRIVVLLEAVLAVVVKGGEKICCSHSLLFLSSLLSFLHTHTHSRTHWAICASLRGSKPKFSSPECHLLQYASTVKVCMLRFICIYLAAVWQGMTASCSQNTRPDLDQPLHPAGAHVCVFAWCLFLSNVMNFGHCS